MISRIFEKLSRSSYFTFKPDDLTHEAPVKTAEQLEAECALRLNEAIGSASTQHLTSSWGDRLLTLDKTAGFKNDSAFAAAFASVKGSHIYDQYNGPDTVAWRLNTLCWAARCALQVGGDFVECGVFKGDFAWVVMQTLGPKSIRKFFLYDSFEGFSTEYSDEKTTRLTPAFWHTPTPITS